MNGSAPKQALYFRLGEHLLAAPVVQDGQRELASPSPAGEEDSDEQDAAENEQARPQDDDPSVVAPEDLVAAPPPAVADVGSVVPSIGGFEGEVLTSPLWDVSTDSSFELNSPEVCRTLIARHRADC